MTDLDALGSFLRRRREALRPDDVGLLPGVRRRTPGLRREEVAILCHLSADYYARLERGQGPVPSASMIAAVAQGLHMSVDERDHLLRLAGHAVPARSAPGEHIAPGLLRVFDRLQADTPAEIVTDLGETLRQTPTAVALTGDASRFAGPSRSLGYRWYTDADTRARYAAEDHPFLDRLFASGLREAAALNGPGSRAASLRDDLLARSDRFRTAWDRQEVGLVPRDPKRFEHPELGRIDLACQTLVERGGSHMLLVYTATPGSPSAEKLRLLTVLGNQQMVPDHPRQ